LGSLIVIGVIDRHWSSLIVIGVINFTGTKLFPER